MVLKMLLKKIEKKWQRILIRTLCILLCLLISGVIGVLGINVYVVLSAKQHILSVEEAAQLSDVDCILVLGCAVREDGSPSVMLRDRLRRGIELYQLGVAPKLLMSGDHGRERYDEVDTMKAFAIDAGIPTEDVFMDHAGFSTYESMYRAKEVFQAEKIIIVTQTYHLYRSIFIARSLGLEAYGVDADLVGYGNGFGREFREVLARVKDNFSCIFKPEPTYLGEPIPVWGNGELTHDENSDFS